MTNTQRATLEVSAAVQDCAQVLRWLHVGGDDVVTVQEAVIRLRRAEDRLHRMIQLLEADSEIM